MLETVVGLIFVIAVLVGIGVLAKSVWMMFLPWCAALFEFLILVWVLYANSISADISGMMYVNFVSLLLVVGFVGPWNLFTFVWTVMDPSDPAEDKVFDAEVKWGNKGFGR